MLHLSWEAAYCSLMVACKSQLQQLLDNLAHELQRADLWSDKPPSPEQLASQEPFCVDTLVFEQWLQWVFLPQLDKLLAMSHFIGLPNRSDIFTMAEYTFKDYTQDTGMICETIRAIDEALNHFVPSAVH